MLPLRSRTSWRLRALTVTCLPRDWAGPVFTILPTIEDADTTCPKHTTASSWNKSGLPGTPASPGPSGPPGRSRSSGPPGPSGPAGPRDAEGTVTSLDQLNGIPAAEAQAPPRSATAATEPSASPAPAHHTNHYQLQLGKSDRPGQYPGHRERPRPGRPGVPSGPPGARVSPMGNSSSRHAAADAVRPTPGRGRMARPTNDPHGQANCPGHVPDGTERPIR